MGEFLNIHQRVPSPSERVCTEVCAAARALDLKEFDYFRLAYRRWFGQQPHEHALEATFVDYMLRQVVPPWVRHLNRIVLEQHGDGSLDPEALGAGRYRDRMRCHPRGRLYVSLMMAAWLVLFSTLLLDVSRPSAPVAMQPGCSETSGSPFFDSWVRMIAGKDAAPCTRPPIDRRRPM
ncbi:MAG: hypothetical protein IPM60_12175 [Rhodospirillales bacterium]|nr:hypothetical protein [Rhodospirillales bacterium]